MDWWTIWKDNKTETDESRNGSVVQEVIGMKKGEELYLVHDDTFVENEEMIRELSSHSYFQSHEYKKELRDLRKKYSRKSFKSEQSIFD
ncbi:MAG: hypothetical protein Q4A72_07540 [Bacillota bacterium]|nr:hypothetical protein [Bacillota bacterium]